MYSYLVTKQTGRGAVSLQELPGIGYLLTWDTGGGIEVRVYTTAEVVAISFDPGDILEKTNYGYRAETSTSVSTVGFDGLLIRRKFSKIECVSKIPTDFYEYDKPVKEQEYIYAYTPSPLAVVMDWLPPTIGAIVGGVAGYVLKPVDPLVSALIGIGLGAGLGYAGGYLATAGVIPIPSLGAPPEGPVAPAQLGKYQITG